MSTPIAPLNPNCIYANCHCLPGDHDKTPFLDSLGYKPDPYFWKEAWHLTDQKVKQLRAKIYKEEPDLGTLYQKATKHGKATKDLVYDSPDFMALEQYMKQLRHRLDKLCNEVSQAMKKNAKNVNKLQNRCWDTGDLFYFDKEFAVQANLQRRYRIMHAKKKVS